MLRRNVGILNLQRPRNDLAVRDKLEHPKNFQTRSTDGVVRCRFLFLRSWWRRGRRSRREEGRRWEAIGPYGVNEETTSIYDIENYILEKIKALQNATDDTQKFLIYTDIGKILAEQAIEYGFKANENEVW